MGGNDSNEMALPLEGGRYEGYAAARGAQAMERGLLSRPNGAGFGFHPALAALTPLYEEGLLSVVANVGWRGAAPSLSHADPGLRYLPDGYIMPGWTKALDGGEEVPVVTGFAGVSAPSGLAVHAAGASKSSAAGWHNRARSGEFRTVFPESSLGMQLKQVASLLAAGPSTGAGRQVYLVMSSGYDTHFAQAERLAKRYADLAASLVAFRGALEEIGLLRQVALYTDSDFGRSLRMNERGGTEHGWGSTQLMFGGAIAGGRVFGEFASMRAGAADDATGTGVWVPSVGKDSYLGEIAAWCGVAGAAPANSLGLLG